MSVRTLIPSAWFAAAALLACGGFGASACTPGEPGTAVEVADAPLTAVEAARLFQRRCASCHGAQGRGDGPSAAIVSPADLTDPALQDRVTNAQIVTLLAEGRGAMPAFTSLTDAEVEGLIRHVRSLRATPTDEGPR